MPRRRTVPSLRKLSLNCLGNNVFKDFIHNVSERVLVTSDLVHTGGGVGRRPTTTHSSSVASVNEPELQRSIGAIHTYLFQDIPQCIGEDLAPLWLAVLGQEVRRKNYSVSRGGGSDDASSVRENKVPSIELNDSVYVMLRLTEVAVWNRLKKLDLLKVSKQLRTFLYNHLEGFTELRYLDLGPGTGGWLSESFLDNFYHSGLSRQNNLVVFRLHHDCTNYLVETIVSQNCDHLRVLDIQFSQFVDDSVVQTIMEKCRPDFLELAITGTAISPRSCANLLKHFRNLKKFMVDNLNEVLSIIQREESEQQNKHVFEIVDFRPKLENSFCFYEPYDIDSLSKTCPCLVRVCLSYSSNYAFNFSFLHRFESLRELVLIGGIYDETNMANLSKVPNLKGLELIHVEMISFKVIYNLSCWNTSLETLSLKNCHLLTGCSPAAASKLKKWTSLTKLIIHSRCEHDFLACLLLVCPGLLELRCGISTEISDRLLCQVIQQSSKSLKALQIFHVAHSDTLTMFGIFQLVNHCNDLGVIQDLDSFSKVTESEIQSLNKWIDEHNVVLKTNPPYASLSSNSLSSEAE